MMLVARDLHRWCRSMCKAAFAFFLFSFNACTFIERLQGVRQCDYPATRVNSTYAVGDTTTLMAGLRDANNASVVCLGVISGNWSSNPLIALITADGFLTAVSVGSTVLEVRTPYGSVRNNITVIATKSPQSFNQTSVPR